MREFNLQEAIAGKPICTRDGHEARFIHLDTSVDTNEAYCISAAIITGDTYDVNCFMGDGRFSGAGENDYDFFMADVEPVFEDGPEPTPENPEMRAYTTSTGKLDIDYYIEILRIVNGNVDSAMRYATFINEQL